MNTQLLRQYIAQLEEMNNPELVDEVQELLALADNIDDKLSKLGDPPEVESGN